MFVGEMCFCLPGEFFELLYFFKWSLGITCTTPASAVLSLLQISRRTLHKSFLLGFCSSVELNLDHKSLLG